MFDPARDAATVVQARGLTKSYGNFPAVAGVDLSITRGEVFALLGAIRRGGAVVAREVR
jgi:ABC-type sugar transport system ATPase subunit